MDSSKTGFDTQKVKMTPTGSSKVNGMRQREGWRKRRRDVHKQDVKLSSVCPEQENNKNSSGDEIPNVNFLRQYRTRTSKYQKKNLIRLTNYMIARQVLRIKSWIYESAT